MRRLIALTLLTTLYVSACKRRPDDAPPEVPPELLSSFEVNDPRAAVQLTRGFYELEGNSWRWTAPEFSAILARPGVASALRLELKLTIPEVVFNQTGPLTISASAAGVPLPPQRFSAPGSHVYAAGFTAPGDSAAIAIDFHVDKYINPGGDDNRDLAVIATAVGLTAQ